MDPLAHVLLVLLSHMLCVQILNGRNPQLAEIPVVVPVSLLPNPRLLKHLRVPLLELAREATPRKLLEVRALPLVGNVLLVM